MPLQRQQTTTTTMHPPWFVVTLLLLLLSFLEPARGAPRVYCGTDTVSVGGRSSLLDQTSSWTVQVPWHVLPPWVGLAEVDPEGDDRAGERVDVERLLSHPAHGSWLRKLMLSEASLVMLGPLELQFTSSIYPPPARRCSGSRKLAIYWSNSSAGSRPFCEYPLPCDAGHRKNHDLHFSVDASSLRVWGTDKPRMPEDGSAFAPQYMQGRGETLETAVERARQSLSVPITVQLEFEAEDSPRLRTVSLRSCVEMDTARVRAAVAHLLSRINPDVAAADADRAAVQSARDMGFVRAHSSPREMEGLLEPVRGCVLTQPDSTCLATLGYVNYGTRTQVVSVEEPDRNWAEPPEIPYQGLLPERFLPGLHRDVATVGWLCRPSTRSWQPLVWTVLGRSVVMTEDAPRCAGDRSFRPERPDYLGERHKEHAAHYLQIVPDEDKQDAESLRKELYGN